MEEKAVITATVSFGGASKRAMKLIPIAAGFFVGFTLATVIGLAIVLPMERDVWNVHMQSEVLGPMESVLASIKVSIEKGECDKAGAQLEMFNKRLIEYRQGGPAPEMWWQEITDIKPTTGISAQKGP